MKNLLIVLLALTTLTSCSKYTSLTKEKYQILNRDGNTDKITARFIREINLELTTNDTIYSEINSKGTAEFNYEKREIKPIPACAKVKIIDPKETSFTVEFIDYNLKMELMLNKNDEWVIKKKNGVILGTPYKTTVSHPEMVFKYKKKKNSKKISLKK